MTKTINEGRMASIYGEVELIKQRLDTLYYKMEEIDCEGSPLETRFLNAKDAVSACGDILLGALDSLRK